MQKKSLKNSVQEKQFNHWDFHHRLWHLGSFYLSSSCFGILKHCIQLANQHELVSQQAREFNSQRKNWLHIL